MAKRFLSFAFILFTGLLCGANADYASRMDDINQHETAKTEPPTPEIRLILADEPQYDDDNVVEIYDLRKDCVVKSVRSTPEIRNMIAEWITRTDGICVKSNPFSDKGYIVKVPFDPPVAANSKWIHGAVEEIYIVLSKQDLPFFIVIDEGGQMSCCPFEGDIKQLSEALGFDFGDR